MAKSDKVTKTEVTIGERTFTQMGRVTVNVRPGELEALSVERDGVPFMVLVIPANGEVDTEKSRVIGSSGGFVSLPPIDGVPVYGNFNIGQTHKNRAKAGKS